MNKSVLPHELRKSDFVTTPLSQNINDGEMSIDLLIEKLINKNKYHKITYIASDVYLDSINHLIGCIDKVDIDIEVEYVVNGKSKMTKTIIDTINRLTPTSRVYSGDKGFGVDIMIFQGYTENTIISGVIDANSIQSFNIVEFGMRSVPGRRYLNTLKNEWREVIKNVGANVFTLSENVINEPIFITKKKKFKKELVWVSKPLKQADLNIPQGVNTNPTGSMSFSQGMFNISQHTYFRNKIFSESTWVHDTMPNVSHMERAYVDMELIIDGIVEGNYNIKLSHNTRKNTPTYKQNNYMTKMSWGLAKEKIAKEELLGKTAKLIKNIGENITYSLVID